MRSCAVSLTMVVSDMPEFKVIDDLPGYLKECRLLRISSTLFGHIGQRHIGMQPGSQGLECRARYPCHEQRLGMSRTGDRP
jgi:hypothetical protein